VKDEFGRMIGEPSVRVSNFIAAILTLFICGWQFSKAKYWSLSKGVSNKNLVIIFKEEKLQSLLGAIFLLIGISKLIYAFCKKIPMYLV